ncbi:regulator of chromosome condensation 1/beta-lactamase-inhibitor protein II [Dichotomocladium elegans]|nr:regulator of chromosome condensation 1/beta-lactamase-inhibitor protein II [Dichotomocladium elegans]
MCNSLRAFGFNGFGQIAPRETSVKASQIHPNIKRVLLATWEATIVLTEENTVQWWGHASELRQQLCASLGGLPNPIQCLFGDIDAWLATLDAHGTVWYTALGHDSTADVRWLQLASDARDAVFCRDMSTVFVLTASGHVESYTATVEKTTAMIHFVKRRWADLPHVYAIAASATHVIFSTAGLDPVYALGSNRFSQLGLDTATVQRLDECTPVDFFSGMGMMARTKDGNHEHTVVSCGLFHSAVVFAGDLYTFGWNKDGRLGWHDDGEEGEVVMPAVFLDDNDERVDVHVVKVACGSAHTLVLDDQGHAWSCGSNKYGQLGRCRRPKQPSKNDDDDDEHENVFRQCTTCQGTIKDVFASKWGSFLILS